MGFPGPLDVDDNVDLDEVIVTWDLDLSMVVDKQDTNLWVKGKQRFQSKAQDVAW